AALSPDGKLLAALWQEKTRVIRLWETASGKELPRLEVKEVNVEVGCLAFSPDGKTLGAGFTMNHLCLWDVRSGRRLEEPAWKGSPWADPAEKLIGPLGASLLLFSPDGKTIGMGTRSGAVRLYDRVTGAQLWQFLGQGPVAAFSPDGRTLATASHDHAVCLWELATGKLRLRLSGHKGEISALAFARDNRSLVSGSADSTALVWDLTGRLAGGEGGDRPLTGEDLEVCWKDLAGEDATRAHAYLHRLAATPAAVPYVAKRLQPVPAPDVQQLARLVEDLDSDQYAVREQAT